ncbi:MAG: cyclic nucleotide-binding domain-containing protein [bacterium]|nr:cyclic nucleotide-binding domain-containing protein [bacterium]
MQRATLSGVDCFAGLDSETLALLEDSMREEEFPAGSVVCVEGEPGEWMFVVASGEVRVVKTMENEAPIQVAVLGPGEFGGIQSLFERKPRSASLVAQKDTRLWTLGHEAFRQVLEANGEMAMAMLSFMSKRMRMDSQNLAMTLRYVERTGLVDVYNRCSPEERLMLDTIIAKIMAADSLDDIMNFLFDALRESSECNRLSLAFLEDDGTRVVSHWVRADYDPILVDKGYALDLKGSSLEGLLVSGKPRIINDLEAYAHEHPTRKSAELLAEEGIRSSMACPLVVDDRPVGFLFRAARTRDAYDEHQVELHMAIAERLGQAVEKAYRIEQLTAANQGYFEMLGFVSHELKSPLSSIVMCTDILKGDYLGDLADKQRDQVERITGKAKYLLDLVGEYLNLSRLESGGLAPSFKSDVDFEGDVLRPSVDIVTPQAEAKGMTLIQRVEGEPAQIECAPELTQVVMVNLMSNAVKYGNEGGEIRVTVTHAKDSLGVSVWNEGPGFPEEERSKLFRKFSRLQTPELLQRKGTGVGLYTTWRIVQVHNGVIEAKSEHGQWAEFSFTIPQPIEG